MASGGALQRVRRDSLPALKTEKSRCAFLRWWWPLRLGRPGPGSGKPSVFLEYCIRSGAVVCLYDGVAAGGGNNADNRSNGRLCGDYDHFVDSGPHAAGDVGQSDEPIAGCVGRCVAHLDSGFGPPDKAEPGVGLHRRRRVDGYIQRSDRIGDSDQETENGKQRWEDQ